MIMCSYLHSMFCFTILNAQHSTNNTFMFRFNICCVPLGTMALYHHSWHDCAYEHAIELHKNGPFVPGSSFQLSLD